MQTSSHRNLVSSKPVAWQRHRPSRLQRALLVCLEIQQGFYTHHHIREVLEEEVSHRQLVHQNTLWVPQVNPTIPWEPLDRMDHRQRLAQEVLVSYG